MCGFRRHNDLPVGVDAPQKEITVTPEADGLAPAQPVVLTFNLETPSPTWPAWLKLVPRWTSTGSILDLDAEPDHLAAEKTPERLQKRKKRNKW